MNFRHHCNVLSGKFQKTKSRESANVHWFEKIKKSSVSKQSGNGNQTLVLGEKKQRSVEQQLEVKIYFRRSKR